MGTPRRTTLRQLYDSSIIRTSRTDLGAWRNGERVSSHGRDTRQELRKFIADLSARRLTPRMPFSEGPQRCATDGVNVHLGGAFSHRVGDRNRIPLTSPAITDPL